MVPDQNTNTINKAHATLQQAGLLEIIYYTDPLCCWSWGFEPQWRKLLFEYSGLIKVRYCMCGLLPGWKNFHDPVNNVTKPIQMGPVWMHAKQLSGMPIEHNIWMTDPPSSSYPASIAVKCAALQSPDAEDLYLRLLREAVMLKGLNIAMRSVLVDTARHLGTILPNFDLEVFKSDLDNEKGFDGFGKDLKEAKYYNISRFPSLVIKNTNKDAIMIAGYRPYSVLMDALSQVTQMEKTNPVINREAFKVFWPFATERELEEIA